VHKALKPENATYPAVSATSYPEGDTARPRESVLSHAFFYNNFPVHKFPETHHYRELELAELVQPGTFRVLRKDGTDMTVEVAAERDAKDAITKILVTFPISREDKYLIPPMTVVLYQLVHPDNPRKRFVEAMSEHLNMTLQ